MTSTISCRTRKNNAPTTSSLPIITRGTHEDTASPPPPHAATARRRTPPYTSARRRTPPSLPLPPRRCLLHFAFAIVRCTLPPPLFAACRRMQLHAPLHATAVVSAVAPALFAACQLRRRLLHCDEGGGAASSYRPSRIVSFCTTSSPNNQPKQPVYEQALLTINLSYYLSSQDKESCYRPTERCQRCPQRLLQCMIITSQTQRKQLTRSEAVV